MPKGNFMLYRIKEKFWSLGDTYNIVDQHGSEHFIVKGKVLSWSDRLSFQDTTGNQLAYISQKLISFRPRYRIYIDGKFDGKFFAEVTKEYTWSGERYLLDVPGPDNYTIDGSLFAHEYHFSRNNDRVAIVSKKTWSWTDDYGVEIIDEKDDVLILCVCIAIDQILDTRKR